MNNKKVLSLFVLSFVTPLLLAFILLKINWSPLLQVNNGTFLTPQITLKDWQLINPKQWSIAQQTINNCDQDCLNTHQQMQQVMDALGKYKSKVDLVLLGSLAAASFPIDLLPTVSLDKASEIKNYPQSHKALQANTLYLIDRFGLIVLAYPLTNNAQENLIIKQGLIKDLKKLFKFARSA